MRLASYQFADGGAGVAVVDDDGVVDLRVVAPHGIRALLATGEGLDRVAQAAAGAPRVALDHDRLLPPISDPGTFVGIGLNYRDHAAQMERPLPERPAIFAKPANAIAAPFARIGRDPAAPTLDYEGELAFVLGRPCHRATPADARAAIAGYMVVNDVTVRDRLSPDTVMWAKGGRGHAPCGPWITTADQVGDPQALCIRTWVNGELRQDGSTADMHRGCAELLAWLSEGLTLMPGDIVTTGSPAGTGASMNPPRYLSPGDRVRIEIERVGAIEQLVEDER